MVGKLTVKELRERLKDLPDKATIQAYEGESICILVYEGDDCIADIPTPLV